MSKKKSIKRFVFMGLVAVVGLLLTFLQFSVPFTNYTYNGFINSISLGRDLGGGYYGLYTAKVAVEGEKYEDCIDETIESLIKMLEQNGYQDVLVEKLSGERVRISLPDTDTSRSTLTTIGASKTLEIKSEDSETAEAELTGQNILSAEYTYVSGQENPYAVKIQFDKEGSEKFYEITSAAAETEEQTIYMYIDGQLFSNPKVEQAISGGQTYISGQFASSAEAEDFALKIMAGSLPVLLNDEDVDFFEPTLGRNADVFAMISVIVVVIVTFAVLIVVYRDRGYMMSLSLLFYLIIMMFLLQSVPIVTLTLYGVIGLIVSFMFATLCQVIIANNIQKEYAMGKKIHTCFKTGFKASMLPIMDISIATCIVSLALLLLGMGMVKGLATVIFLGSFVCAFMSFVITRPMLNLYLPLNSKNNKSLNLTREESVDELK